MGGTNGITTQHATPAPSSAPASQPQSTASTRAQGTSQPPPLYQDFTNDSLATSQEAKNTQKDIQQFYSGQYTHDWQALQSAGASGDPAQTQKAETVLAADIAALHNLEKQFYQANGDSAHQAGKYDQANFTQEGTTESLLAQAGAPDAKSTDYTYRGVTAGGSDGSGIQVTASLNKSPGFQATAAPVRSNDTGQVQTQSSSGPTGQNWTSAANTGSLVPGQSNTQTTYYSHDDQGEVIPDP